MFEFAAIEFLWIEFRIKHRDGLCGVCYRPPDIDSVSLAYFFEYFQLVLDKIRQLPKQEGGNGVNRLATKGVKNY